MSPQKTMIEIIDSCREETKTRRTFDRGQQQAPPSLLLDGGCVRA